MTSALDVARFFLASNPAGSITNLKLQNLCAYAQAVACSYLGEKIFQEDFEMWELGPVIPEIYKAYKAYYLDPIPTPRLDLSQFSMTERLVLAGVNTCLAEMFDAWDLCLKSHEDFPGVRGSNPRLTFEELQQAAHDSDIVRQLKQADEPIADSAYMKTLLAKDALHALAN